MAEIGKINRLPIKRTLEYDAHLDGGELGDILLPQKYVPKNCQPGDIIEVFVYADKEKRLRATTQKPYATVGEFVYLKVVANSAAGAYLDWGLPKNLLVPTREQQSRMEEGKSYVVCLFLEQKTHRITASSKLDKFISFQSPAYDEGEEVDLIICGQSDLGYKVVVNNAHWGIVYKNEVFQKVHIGQRLKGYIKTIREDLKIDIRLQQSGYQQVDSVAQGILKKIQASEGTLAVTDKSPPQEIYAQFGVSKKVFKKAIGALYKKRLITISANAIKLTQKSA